MRRPSGPPEDALGKVLIAWAISSSDTWMVGADSSGIGGVHESGCGGGCLDQIAASVASFNSTMESSEQIRQTALLKSLSSNFQDTRATRELRGLWEDLEPCLLGRVGGGGSASSLSS